MTVCFTGHRPQSLPFGFDESHPDCLAIKAKLKDEIKRQIKNGAASFLSGMALGVDMWAAEAVLELKAKKYPFLSLTAVIPCPNQALKWNKDCKRRYDEILNACDEKIVTSPAYFAGCMHVRNKYMVDRSDVLIAVYNQSEKGGTASTVRYAKKKCKEIVEILI